MTSHPPLCACVILSPSWRHSRPPVCKCVCVCLCVYLLFATAYKTCVSGIPLAETKDACFPMKWSSSKKSNKRLICLRATAALLFQYHEVKCLNSCHRPQQQPLCFLRSRAFPCSWLLISSVQRGWVFLTWCWAWPFLNLCRCRSHSRAFMAESMSITDRLLPHVTVVGNVQNYVNNIEVSSDRLQAETQK